MAVKIRLKQTGKKNRRSFRIVVVDESKKRDGKVIENLGYLNYQTKPYQYKLDQERINFWLKQGAQATEAVYKLIHQP